VKVYLGLDTATPNLVLGLYSPEKGVLGIYENGLEPHATKQIIPQLDKLLSQAQLKKTDLAGITVGVGPGSYTGIKVGIATAKGLAKGLNIPLQGKSTLEAIAFTKLSDQEKAIVSLDARRHNLYYGMYFRNGSQVLSLIAEEKSTLDNLKETYPNTMIYTDGLPSAEYLASFTSFGNSELNPKYL